MAAPNTQTLHRAITDCVPDWLLDVLEVVHLSTSTVAFLVLHMEASTSQDQAGGGGGADIGLRIPFAHFQEDPPDVVMTDADTMLATPLRLPEEVSVALSGPWTQPYRNTRSRNSPKSGERVVHRPSPALRRLQVATKSSRATTALAGSENYADPLARDADSPPNNTDNAVENVKPKTRRAPSVRLDGGRVGAPRRSERIRSHRKAQTGTLITRKRAPRVTKIIKKASAQINRLPAGYLRRSARLAKPLTEFYKYSNLPPELRMIVWEQAISPRLVYLRNRQAPNYTHKVQTPEPKWIWTDTLSGRIARTYKMRFGLQNPQDNRTRQLVNTNADIIVLEPCCNGCRGYWCTRHQFSDEDRQAVRFLAIQTDSPNLAPFARPCWETISSSFPMVETLYLMKTALKGDQTKEQALIRIEEGDREMTLRKKFDEWKKGMGKVRPLTKLEFVVIVDKEPDSIDTKKRYKDIEERKTNSPEDIILS